MSIDVVRTCWDGTSDLIRNHEEDPGFCGGQCDEIWGVDLQEISPD